MYDTGVRHSLDARLLFRGGMQNIEQLLVRHGFQYVQAETTLIDRDFVDMNLRFILPYLFDHVKEVRKFVHHIEGFQHNHPSKAAYKGFELGQQYPKATMLFDNGLALVVSCADREDLLDLVCKVLQKNGTIYTRLRKHTPEHLDP